MKAFCVNLCCVNLCLFTLVLFSFQTGIIISYVLVISVLASDLYFCSVEENEDCFVSPLLHPPVSFVPGLSPKEAGSYSGSWLQRFLVSETLSSRQEKCVQLGK